MRHTGLDSFSVILTNIDGARLISLAARWEEEVMEVESANLSDGDFGMALAGSIDSIVTIVQLIPEERRRQISQFRLKWEKTYDSNTMYPVIEITFSETTKEG